MRLGTLLLRDAVIGLSQLEEALRAQVLYGGRLGTNLIELDLIDLDTLGVYLAKVHATPVATAARFDAADPAVVARFGRELAERHTALPLGPERLRPETIAVAMADPGSASRIDEIQRALGAPIAPYVAAELRIHYYLEVHYGVPRRPRFLRPAEEGGAPAGAGHDRRRTQPAPNRTPSVVRFEPKSRGKRDTVPRNHAPALVSLDEARRGVASAGHRDQIGDAVIDLAGGRLASAVLFIVRAKSAIGWRGLAQDGKRLTGAQIDGLVLPLGGASVLQIACDTARVYRGPSPAAGQPVEREVWKALGVVNPPGEMLVVPVVVGQRVVNLLYGHGPARAVTDEHLVELQQLAEDVAAGYQRLIQAARGDKDVRGP